MIQACKICGISDSKTLEFLTSHSTPPKMIGFICNWPKSKRFVEHDKLKELLKVNKKKTEYVAVLVKPNEDILERIKDLPFDYYQLYDCTPTEVRSIKEKYNKKEAFPSVSLSVKNPASSKVLILMIIFQIMSNIGILFFLYLGME